MALLLFDGFELVSPAEFLANFNKWDYGANVTLGVGTGRFSGGNAITFTGTALSQHLAKDLVNLKTTFMAVANSFRAPLGVPTYPSGEQILCSWVDGATVQVTITIGATGLVKAYRGGVTGTLLGTSSSSVTLTGGYHYWEVKAVIGNADGAVVFRLDGTTILNLTAIDTQNSANAYATQFKLGGNGVDNSGWGFTGSLDDFSLLDDTGAAPYNTWLPECRIDGLWPTGSGNSTVWTPNVGANWQNVDDPNTMDSDTTYNASSTPADIDTFTTRDLPSAVGTVYAVSNHLWARKDDAAVRQVAVVMRMGGTDNVRGTNTMGSGYDLFFEIMTADPAAAAWTIASVNAMELGYKEIA